MNWKPELEVRSHLVFGGILLVSFFALCVTILRNPIAYDSFWHLRMGMDWIENGLSPWVDHYSFTYPGHPISNPPVVFQALLHTLVSNLGLRAGFMVVKVLAYSAVLGSVIGLLRQIRAPLVLSVLVLPAIIYLLQMRSMVRPEIFSYAFSVLALMLYFRFDNGISLRKMLPVFLLVFAWTNYHSSVIGYVIFAGLFLDLAYLQYREKAPATTWALWLGCGLLVLLAGFLNPGMTHPVIQALSFPAEWKSIIHEYLSPQTFLKGNPGIYLILLLALLMPVLAVRQRRPGLLLIWMVLFYAGFTMQRMVTPAGIVITLLLAYLLVNEPGIQQRLRKQGRLSNGVTIVASLLIVGFVFANVKSALNIFEENQKTFMRFPEVLVDYMEREGIHGRIINAYGIGGYLIYRLAPHSQVYIDGRTQMVYPIEHMHTFQATREEPEKLQREIEKYQVDLVIRRFGQTSHDVVMQAGGLDLDFLGPKYALYRRQGANFPLLGQLISKPACWNPSMQHKLEAERQKMGAILPSNSRLYPFANFVIGYGGATNGRQFLDQSIEVDEWTDEMRRFAAYRLFEAGEWEIARLLFGGVVHRQPGDFLAPAMAMMIHGQWDLASQILVGMTGVDWKWLKPGDVLIYYALYARLGQYRTLTPVEKALLDGLDKRLTKLGISERSVENDASVFCN